MSDYPTIIRVETLFLNGDIQVLVATGKIVIYFDIDFT